MHRRATPASSKALLHLCLAAAVTLPGGDVAPTSTSTLAQDERAPRATAALPAFAVARRAFASRSCGGIEPPVERIVVRHDLPYAVLGGRTLRLDFARPAGTRHAPIVLLVHGGGFRGGDKRDLERLLLGLAGSGYAAASVEYRLIGRGEAEFPAGVADVRCAARFLKRRAAALGGDGDRMAAIGFSAGGHLVASLALQGEVSALDGECPDHDPLDLDGAVAFYPPLDFRPAVPWSPLIRAALRRVLSRGLGHRGPSGERAPRQLAEVEELASPIAYADPEDAPVLLIHGVDDRVVPIARARDALRHARAAGAPLELLEVRGMPHGFGMSRPGAPRAPTCAALAFLHARLGAET
jgi:acetyl esterase/lipase